MEGAGCGGESLMVQDGRTEGEETGERMSKKTFILDTVTSFRFLVNSKHLFFGETLYLTVLVSAKTFDPVKSNL